MEYRIKEILEERNLTLKQLAEMIGVDPSNLSSSLKNTANPSISRLQKIAEALQVDIADLFRRKHPLYGYLEVFGHPKKVEEIEDLINVLWNVMGDRVVSTKRIPIDPAISPEEEKAFIDYYNTIKGKRSINFKKLILITGYLSLINPSSDSFPIQ